MVAVAGDITPRELEPRSIACSAICRAHAHLTSVGEIVWPQEPPTILVPREGTQTELLFAMPGPKRDDPDWYAAEIANYILGGGGFSSRLMQDVRDKKGLTYGIETGRFADGSWRRDRRARPRPTIPKPAKRGISPPTPCANFTTMA